MYRSVKYSAIADAVQTMEEERVEKELRVGRDGGGQPTAIALAFADVATKAVAKTRGVRWRPPNPPPVLPAFPISLSCATNELLERIRKLRNDLLA